MYDLITKSPYQFCFLNFVLYIHFLICAIKYIIFHPDHSFFPRADNCLKTHFTATAFVENRIAFLCVCNFLTSFCNRGKIQLGIRV